ncbi:hypothetical protein AZ78_2426 [Lysobacter capsici AZ78]|uniref:Haem-binding uptake Tiki superfamily ChaN domain-containing protein n=1 Tax=Lysobacter capsici AZ78 TaxID=1444315 RepID=A0A108U973_9GAMM|nr:hypothetical protein [Lysobacter capsici]KWS04876.1 hypothetical protein AZ78_2426 [Lysobacter capsici AZ78]
MKSLLMLLGATLAIALGSTDVRAQATEATEKTEKTFVDAVKARAMPLRIASSGLSGAGAGFLLERAAASQFVLIGEDHGFADTPRFAQGLQASLGDRRLDHLVLEIGYYAARRVEASLCERKDGLAQLNQAFPFFSPFVNFKEDGALAASFAACDPAAPSLWGIDQEFLLSSQLHLDRLQQLTTNEPQRKQLAVFRREADEAWNAMVAKHDPGSIALVNWTAEDFSRLRGIFNADRDPEAVALIDAMAASSEIYRSQNTGAYASNRARSVMMKSLFMRNYQAARAKQERPRALFKLGAYHAARGLTPTQQFDIGNLASELAESNGERSFHVLVLMNGGEVNRHFPFSADSTDERAAYDAKEELKTLGIEALLAVAPSDDAVVIDLASLRADGPRMPPGNPINRLIYNYDAVVLVAKGHAASSY